MFRYSHCGDSYLSHCKIIYAQCFTPNNDGLNDVFIPVGSFIGIRNYNFTIWNRWGDRIFYTDETEGGWNGQRNNNGEIASPGVYAYLLEYTDVKGDRQLLKGYCTLVR
ncbi:MAG: gliding motility-associated C-terminal domain-containing protein [Saprospiraceae bacterium]|nr:gliding motility-associated C-terminal domain-containing protein [Saprospiraceae bacterium]